jgi:hypothetical protein
MRGIGQKAEVGWGKGDCRTLRRSGRDSLRPTVQPGEGGRVPHGDLWRSLQKGGGILVIAIRRDEFSRGQGSNQ